MKTVLMLSAVALIATALDLQPTPAGRWRTAWATSQQTVGMSPIANTTLRLIARVTIGGDAVRIRLDNTYGKSPLTIGAASIGLRARGATITAGSSQPVRFGGAATVTIPPGGTVRSDPMPLKVIPRQDLAVSLYVSDRSALPSQHSGALTTSYVAAAGAGDQSAVESGESFKETITTMPWLKAIDVQSSSATGATGATGVVIAFGDSITDGTCATLDAYDRWEDWLAIRLALEADRRGRPNQHKAVLNEGIG